MPKPTKGFVLQNGGEKSCDLAFALAAKRLSIIRYARGEAVIREGQWKLFSPSRKRGEVEFYDIPADSFEKNDVAATHPEIVKSFQAKVSNWRDPLPEGIYQDLRQAGLTSRFTVSTYMSRDFRCSLGRTSGVTVNTGGTLLLIDVGTDRIKVSATVVLAGGTIAFSDFSEPGDSSAR